MRKHLSAVSGRHLPRAWLTHEPEGPNAAWERESLTRIAHEVLPALREKTAAA